MYSTWLMVTLNAASLSPCPFTLSSTEMRKGVTVVPISAPIMVATASDMGSTPLDVKATTMESKAPELCSNAVDNQPAKTPLVVSLINSTILSARASPMMVADDLMSTMAETKKYSAVNEPRMFLALDANEGDYIVIRIKK